MKLEYVDHVCIFEEDTPYHIIGVMKPNILVKGGDYKPEEIAGGQAVIENGGQVRVLNFVDGLSTSAVIDAIKKKV